MFKVIRQRILKRYQSWLDQRIPSKSEFVLNNRRIFIFLSKAGFAYLALLVLLLIVAVNYQNNMVFALLFLLVSIFIVAVLHTYRNLSGLKVTFVSADNAFVGDSVRLRLRFSAASHAHQALLCRWQTSAAQVYLDKGEDALVDFHLQAQERGLFRPQRLLIESTYPLGLLRAWTWLSFDVDALVYPKPLANKLPVFAMLDVVEGEGELSAAPGVDDFYGFRSYQVGDSLKHVHWPSYAKGQSMQVKEFGSEDASQPVLNFNHFSGDSETRLSAICFWVLRFCERQAKFSLILPGEQIGPASGEGVKTQALRALALFNKEARHE